MKSGQRIGNAWSWHTMLAAGAATLVLASPWSGQNSRAESGSHPRLSQESRAGESGAVAIDEQQVVALALRAHPTVDAALAASDAARAATTGVTLSRVPELEISARYTRLSSIPERLRNFDGLVFPQLLNNVGVRAQLSVQLTDTFLVLASAARAAGLEADAAALEVVTAKAQVAYEARAAFLGYWSRTLAVANATELLRAAESNVKDQRRREAAGTVARNEVLSFETAVDAAAMSLEAARGELAAAEATLRTYLPELAGKALSVPDLPLLLDGTATSASPAPSPNPPQLAALALHAQAAEAKAQSTSRSRLPRLSAYAAGDVSAPSPRVFILTTMEAVPTWEAGVRLDWSLSQATTGTARATQARHEHRVMLARLAEAKRKLTGEREGTQHVLAAAHNRVQRAGQRVQHASDLARARRIELEAGTALALNVVLAEGDLARAKNEYVDAYIERALARAKLDFLDGRIRVGAEQSP